MNKKYVLGGLMLLAGYALSTSIVPVKETEYMIVSQFGRPVRVVDQAGPVLKLPDPIQTILKIDKRLQTLAIPSAEYGTRDRRNVVMDISIVWQVAEPERFLVTARSTDVAEQRLETLANAEVGSEVATVPLDRIFSSTLEHNELEQMFSRIETAVADIALRELGIRVVSIRPGQLGYPVQNLQAIYNRMTSEWDRLAKQYHAEGMEAAAKIQAETEREVREMLAKAQRDGQRMLGQSEAQAARYFADALADNPEYYKLVRTMEGYKTLFNENSRLILPADADIFAPLFNSPEIDLQ